MRDALPPCTFRFKGDRDPPHNNNKISGPAALVPAPATCRCSGPRLTWPCSELPGPWDSAERWTAPFGQLLSASPRETRGGPCWPPSRAEPSGAEPSRAEPSRPWSGRRGVRRSTLLGAECGVGSRLARRYLPGSARPGGRVGALLRFSPRVAAGAGRWPGRRPHPARPIFIALSPCLPLQSGTWRSPDLAGTARRLDPAATSVHLAAGNGLRVATCTCDWLGHGILRTHFRPHPSRTGGDRLGSLGVSVCCCSWLSVCLWRHHGPKWDGDSCDPHH
jgi:hypothetical protein